MLSELQWRRHTSMQVWEHGNARTLDSSAFENKSKASVKSRHQMSFGLSDCLKEGRNRLPRCPGQQLFNVKNSSGCWMPVQPGQAPSDHIKVPANVSR